LLQLLNITKIRVRVCTADYSHPQLEFRKTSADVKNNRGSAFGIRSPLKLALQ